MFRYKSLTLTKNGWGNRLKTLTYFYLAVIT